MQSSNKVFILLTIYLSVFCFFLSFSLSAEEIQEAKENQETVAAEKEIVTVEEEGTNTETEDISQPSEGTQEEKVTQDPPIAKDENETVTEDEAQTSDKTEAVTEESQEETAQEEKEAEFKERPQLTEEAAAEEEIEEERSIAEALKIYEENLLKYNNGIQFAEEEKYEEAAKNFKSAIEGFQNLKKVDPEWEAPVLIDLRISNCKKYIEKLEYLIKQEKKRVEKQTEEEEEIAKRKRKKFLRKKAEIPKKKKAVDSKEVSLLREELALVKKALVEERGKAYNTLIGKIVEMNSKEGNVFVSLTFITSDDIEKGQLLYVIRDTKFIADLKVVKVYPEIGGLVANVVPKEHLIKIRIDDAVSTVKAH